MCYIEALSGKGTSHRVNGIAVPPRVFGPDLPPKDRSRIDKRKERTLSKENQPQLDVYVAGPRVGPHLLKTKDDYAGEANKAARNAEQKNMLWILARQLNSEDQKGSSSTPDVVEYLLTINAPATEVTSV